MTHINDEARIEFSAGSAEWTLTATGDLCPIGKIEHAFVNQKPESVITAPLMDYLQNADLSIMNLESPLCSAQCPIPKTGPNFIASPDVAPQLYSAGFHVAALANNHILDQDLQGLAQTLDVLSDAGVRSHGAARTHDAAAAPLRVNVTGTGVSLLNCAEGEFARAYGNGPGAASLDVHRTCRLIRCEAEEGRVVVVTVHAGNEYQPFPSTMVRDVYRTFAEAGAALVIGHHPHIPQGVERWAGGFIAYSLGNFLFDYGGHQAKAATKIGYLVCAAFAGSVLRTVTLVPYRKQPTAAVTGFDPDDTSRFASFITALSEPLGDPDLHRRLWEQEARDLYASNYGPLIERVWAARRPADGPADDRTNVALPGEQARAMFNLYRCEAHNYAMQTALRLMHEGRFDPDAEAARHIKSAHETIEALVADTDEKPRSTT